MTCMLNETQCYNYFNYLTNKKIIFNVVLSMALFFLWILLDAPDKFDIFCNKNIVTGQAGAINEILQDNDGKCKRIDHLGYIKTYKTGRDNKSILIVYQYSGSLLSLFIFFS